MTSVSSSSSSFSQMAGFCPNDSTQPQREGPGDNHNNEGGAVVEASPVEAAAGVIHTTKSRTTTKIDIFGNTGILDLVAGGEWCGTDGRMEYHGVVVLVLIILSWSLGPSFVTTRHVERGSHHETECATHVILV